MAHIALIVAILLCISWGAGGWAIFFAVIFVLTLT
jgi:hypothetical protein